MALFLFLELKSSIISIFKCVWESSTNCQKVLGAMPNINANSIESLANNSLIEQAMLKDQLVLKSLSSKWYGSKGNDTY